MVLDDEYSMVITTCADRDSAKRLAGVVIQAQLAACVQLFQSESIYLWNGEVCDESETVLFLKTKTALFDKLTSTIRENHSYEVPEIIRLPITGGLPEYLNWIDDAVLNA